MISFGFPNGAWDAPDLNWNTDCFQADWREFSQAYPHQLHLIQMDNATGHTTKRLMVPDNIILGFQPAHSPAGNPIERFWAWIKGPIA